VNPRRKTAPFGTWKSPITSDLIVSDVVRLADPVIDGTDIYWTELRPTEGGRIVLVKRTLEGTTTDVTPAGFNVRTRVHEYGGGAFVVRDGDVWFANFKDQRLYRQADGGQPVPITPERDLRFADGVVDSGRARLVCVREDHTVAGREAENTLVAIDLEQGGPGEVLASGRNFYSNPRNSPDGARLAWVEWDHPNMPWDTTELSVARLDAAGKVSGVQHVAGGDDESIQQPLWSPDGVLYYISDRSGWWNLYRWTGSESEPVFPKNAEFAGAAWVFGQSNYGFESAESLLCVYHEAGKAHLTRVNTRTLETSEVPTPFTSISCLQVAVGQAVFVGGSPTAPTVVARLDLQSGAIETLRASSTIAVDPEYLSIPEPIEFPTEDGLTAHAFYYPPANRDFSAPADEKPPLLVRSHGGPTGAATRDFNLSIQYWTSRGFAFVDVNYGGSTGYGREYRNRLRGNWGVVDVDDCVNAAQYLVRKGLADPERLAIDGGSAGGYTTLCALAFRDVFAAGASLFGLSDLVIFVGDTHKFESRYLDSLVGPWPEREDVYRERSPINALDRFSCPIAFFQGDEDKIVPPNQSELMVDALREKGIPVAYVLFAGEQHGFRKAENIKRALDGEFYFFSRIFGFAPADEIEPLPIDNLP
jgi:dipeptidyl aminopeptidase/acylaminoacyl peptidase